jgi:molecular chaperone GrpE
MTTLRRVSAQDKPKGFKVSDRRFWAEGQTDGAVPVGGNGQADTTAPSAEPPSPQYPTYVEQLRAELAEKDKQLREYIAAYKEQVVKGIEDTKERLRRESERELELLRGKVVEALLPVLDDLDRSLQAAGDRRDPLIDGVRLVRDEFQSRLGALGLAPIVALGQPFDPVLHEAVAVASVTDPAQDGTVLGVVRGGFRFGERVLRPAIVQVGKLAS